jgi:protein CLEC16A
MSSYFCEMNMLRRFLLILSQTKASADRQVTVQILQTISIMIANLSKPTSLYYMLSNDHVNDLIKHEFDFKDEEVLAKETSSLLFVATRSS